jgi:ankyrin repeat protein
MIDEKEFCHEIWLKCMQMNQCNQHEADSFLSKCSQYVNHPLTESGQTLLMVACSIGSLPIVNSCLKHGVNVLMRDTVGRNALHYAAAVGNI